MVWTVETNREYVETTDVETTTTTNREYGVDKGP